MDNSPTPKQVETEQKQKPTENNSNMMSSKKEPDIQPNTPKPIVKKTNKHISKRKEPAAFSFSNF